MILAGRSRWVFVGPNGTQDVFEAGKGDVIFAPQGTIITSKMPAPLRN